MSITTAHPSNDQPLTWRQAADDVHVATRDGEFAGFVEVNDSAHLVRDNRGAELGAFASLAAARAALESAHRGLSTPGRSSWRRLLRRARS